MKIDFNVKKDYLYVLPQLNLKKYPNLAPLKQDCVCFCGTNKKDNTIGEEDIEFLSNKYGIEKGSDAYNRVADLLNKGIEISSAADIVDILKDDDNALERCVSLLDNIENKEISDEIAKLVREEIDDEAILSLADSLADEEDSYEIYDNILWSDNPKEAVKTTLDISVLIKEYDLDVTLHDLAGYDIKEQKQIVGFMIDNDLSFDKTVTYFDAISKPKPTNADDVYPLELSDEELTKKYGSNIVWSKIAEDMYDQIRRTHKYAVEYEKKYSGSYGELCRIIEENKGVTVKDKHPWATRKAKGTEFKSAKERISLNVVGDADLIKKLDDLMIKTNGAFIYKTYSDPSRWSNREDPVTLYFQDEITPEIYDEIANITKTYARGRLNEVSEDSETPWMMKEKYAKGDLIAELALRAKKFDENLYRTIVSDAGIKLTLSSGMYRAYSKVIDEYERYLHNANNNVQ